MIRVELPAHLRTLAQVDDEVKIDVEGEATQRSVLDALEACYPMLRGTIRDRISQERRPFLRFFACETDLSHEPPDAPLPDGVASGAEPLLIIGALAGGQEATLTLHASSESDLTHSLSSEVRMTPSQERNHKGSILVIHDEPAGLELLFTILTEHGYAVRERQLDLQPHSRFVKDTLADLVLVDVRKPDTDGYQVCASLTNDPTTRAIPVMFISSIDRSVNQAKALLSGAVDYVTNPFDAEEVLWRIETHISLRRLRENLKSAACNHGTQPLPPNGDLERAFQEIRVLTEVTGRKHAEEKVRQSSRELKKAEEALQSSERSLAAIINTIPTTAWTTRPDGYCDFLNQVWLDYVGMTAEQAQGWGWAEAIHPDDRKSLVEEWQSCLASGTPVDTEARIRRYDASYRAFLIRANPLRDESGNILKWYGTCTDIDDRKRGEEDLRARELSWRQIVDNVPGLVATMGPMGEVEFLNRQTLEYFGKTDEELKNWSLIGAVHPDDLPGVIEARKKCILDGQLYEVEHRCRRADGVYRWFQVRGLPVRDRENKITVWYLLLADIDDRKRAEAQFEQAYLRLAEAQRLSKTGSFITDLVADEHNWSEETFRIFEFDPTTKVTVQRIRNLIEPEDLPSFDAMIARAVKGADVDFVFRILTSRGSLKHIRGMARVIEQVAGRPLFIGALQDVTESKIAEESLSKARSELAHVARITTLNALTASIAHEINQPLASLITNASICLRRLNADPPNLDGARETAVRTIRDGNRASDVITRLRALYSKKEFTPEPVDLNDATREVVALYLSDLQRNRVILKSELADALPLVTGDRVQLQQVILNLVRNASDAMTSVDDRPRELVIRTEQEGVDRVRLSVKDAGLGFTREAADKLFQAFYTTKNDGMGIGLHVSHSIIEAHHGRLWATANDGPGATFSFAIPSSPENSEDIDSSSDRTDAA
jgi:PAS domain S-box-containing protein